MSKPSVAGSNPAGGTKSRPQVALDCAFVVRPVVQDADNSSQESKLTHGLPHVTECLTFARWQPRSTHTAHRGSLWSRRRLSWRFITTTPVYDENFHAELDEVTLVQGRNKYIEVLREQREQGIVGDVASGDN